MAGNSGYQPVQDTSIASVTAGRWIAEQRKKHHITIRRLAELSDVDVPTIKTCEVGKLCDLKILGKIMTVLWDIDLYEENSSTDYEY